MRPAAAAICGLWVTMTTVWPSRFSCMRSAITASVDSESRFPVGSSAHTIAGRCTSARATATRCCSPPESWSGRWPALPPSPTLSNVSSARALARLPPIPCNSMGSSTFSAALSTGSRLKAWKTKPMYLPRYAVRWLSPSPARLAPSTRISPSSMRSRPDRQFSNVVLPDPDGPTMASSSPRGMSRSIPLRAATSLPLR